MGVLKERRRWERKPHAVTMEQSALANHWQALCKKKWAEEDQRKKEKK